MLFASLWLILLSSLLFLVSCPSIVPLLAPLMKYTGFMTSLPRLTEAALQIIEMRKKEEGSSSVSKYLDVVLKWHDCSLSVSPENRSSPSHVEHW